MSVPSCIMGLALEVCPEPETPTHPQSLAVVARTCSVNITTSVVVYRGRN